jgi:tRNA(Phe) wybutosine-synthesizing methylase Tyw3
VGDKFYIILQGTVTVQIPNEAYKKNIQAMIKDEVLKMVLQAGKTKAQENAAELERIKLEMLTNKAAGNESD